MPCTSHQTVDVDVVVVGVGVLCYYVLMFLMVLMFFGYEKTQQFYFSLRPMRVNNQNLKVQNVFLD